MSKESKKLNNVTEKPWGHELLIAKNDLYVVKQLFVKAKCRLSLQLHRQKVEHITLITGSAAMFIENDRGQSFFEMSPMEPVDIPAGTVHRLFAGDDDAILVEVSTPELDDVVRIEDDYGRQDNLEAQASSGEGDYGLDGDLEFNND